MLSTIRVIMSEDNDGKFIVAITTVAEVERYYRSQWPDSKSISYEMNLADPNEPVYIVTTGTGHKYRVACLTQNKRTAVRFATSISGKIITQQLMQRLPRGREAVFHRWFVNLDTEEIYPRGTVRRYLHEEGDEDPYCTLRRRYDESLPNRLEVAARSERCAEEIAHAVLDWSISEIKEKFEYNVETRMLLQFGEWRIHPCMVSTPVS